MGRKRFKFRKPLSLDGLFYSHGLMCASYPRTVLCFVAVVVISFSLPFFITSSGDLNKPITWRSPWLNYRTMASSGEGLEWIIKKSSQSSGRTPSWFHGLPVAVVQQYYVHLHINCKRVGHLCDRPYDSTSKLAASHLLGKMEHTISGCRKFMHPAILNLTDLLGSTHMTTPHPTGVLSPVLDSYKTAWKDTPIDYQTIKELVYGGFWEHAHSSADQVQESSQDSLGKDRNGQDRSLVFALTLMFLASGRGDFPGLVSCAEEVGRLWERPREEPSLEEEKKSLKFLKHIYYERDWSLMDFAPLMGVYSIVFLYISFSVGKIDLVKSKVGLGFTAFITVVASLTMSLGVCTFFGLSISLSGSEIYPYVVITLGLENILIIVKAVITTPEELEVKYRIGVGLSREGRAITRNLVTLVALTSFGIIFFNYVLKEFCIIALVGLVCDGFLQLFFFPTVLSIDLRRLELSDLNSTTVPVPEDTPKTRSNSSCRPRCPSKFQQVTTPMRWHSKRIKFIYFLARTRIVSRLMMVSLLVLLFALFVKIDAFHTLVNRIISAQIDTPTPSSNPRTHRPDVGSDITATHPAAGEPQSNGVKREFSGSAHGEKGKDHSSDRLDMYWNKLVAELNETEMGVVTRSGPDGFAQMCKGQELCWRPMVSTHWPRLLNYAGYSTEGRFLTLLPPINLDFNLGHTPLTYPSLPPVSVLAHFIAQPLVVRFFMVIMVVVIILSYAVYLIQSSWYRHQRYLQSVRLKNYDKLTCLKGHTQDIDLMCVDNAMAVTASLDGDVRVWDLHPMKRRCVRVLSRSNLCQDPPADVLSSHRPAAEGCEATQSFTPGTSTPTIKYQARNGRRYSAISSHSSALSDNYDFHGNGDQLQESKNHPQSASRLSDVLDVSHSNVCDTALEGRRSSQSQIPQQSVVPVREFPTMDKSASGISSYADMSSRGSGAMSMYYGKGTSQLSSEPASSSSSYPSLQQGSLEEPRASSQPLALPSSQQTPHPSSQQGSHPSPHQVSRPSLPPIVSCHPQTSQPISPLSLHSPQIHVELELDGGHIHQVTPTIPTAPPASSVLSTSQQLTNPPDLQQNMAASGAPSFPYSTRHNPTPSWANPTRGSLPGSRTLTLQPVTATLPGLAPRGNPASVMPSGSQMENGLIPAVHITTSLVPPTSSHNSAGSLLRSSSLPRRFGHARHASLGNRAPLTLPNHRHSRNRSLGSISNVLTPSHFAPLLTTVNSNPSGSSLGNLSQLSNNSTHGSEMPSGSLPLAAPPTGAAKATASSAATEKERGYDFAQHFNLFSQFTSNMALEYCVGDASSSGYSSGVVGKVSPSVPPLPPVWCMDVHNKVLALGCKDGKIEVWSISTGSLMFEHTIGSSGVCTIAVGKMGVVAGQMDGSLSVMGHNGLLHHVIPAHDRAVSVLRLYQDSLLVSGSYDCSVKVHRTSTPLQHQLVCVNSIYVHEGRIADLTIVESQLKLGCVSGCTNGLVIHWDVNTGTCINELGSYSSAVLQLESTLTHVVGLFSEACVRVWNSASGEMTCKMQLGEVSFNLALLSPQYVAVSLESCIEVYDLESGSKHSPEVELQVGTSCSSVGRRLEVLDEGSTVACTCGKDIYLIPCHLKLKND